MRCSAGALDHLLRLAEVNQQTLATLGAVSSLSYAWGLLDDLIPVLHTLVSLAAALCTRIGRAAAGLREGPLVSKLRCCSLGRGLWPSLMCLM